MYKIGEVTARTNLSTDTLRYYEKIDLLPKIARNNSGVRFYSDKDISRLNFIKRVQSMNFKLAEIKQLLSMREDPQHAKDEVRQLTAKKLNDIENHLTDLTILRNELSALLNLCHASTGCCPIIENLDSDTHK